MDSASAQLLSRLGALTTERRGNWLSLNSIAMAPVKIIVALVAGTVVSVVVGAVLFVLCVGYPRPFWSHHSLNLETYARELAQRLVDRAETVRSALSSTDPMMQRLKAEFPALVTFGHTRGPGSSAPQGDTSQSELVDSVFHSILSGAPDQVCLKGGPLLQAACQLAAQGDGVTKICQAFEAQLADGSIPTATQLAACALADVRWLASVCVPKVCSMHQDRIKKLDLLETVAYHVRDDFEAYKSSVRATFKMAKEKGARAQATANRVINFLDATASRLCRCGEVREGFGGIIGMILKPFQVVFDLCRGAFEIVKVLAKIFAVLGTFMKDLIDFIVAFFQALKFVAGEFGKGFLTGVVSLISIAIGLALKLALVFLRPVARILVVYYFTYAFPIVLTAYQTVVFAVVFAIKVVIGVADFFTKGSLRILARSDAHPEAWWKQAGFEQGNHHTRNVVLWYPCALGWHVSPSGLFCERACSSLPRRSPASLLTRKYILGNMWAWDRRTPARSAEALERFDRLKIHEYRQIYKGHGGAFIKDLVWAIALCRNHVLGSSELHNELAYHVMGDVKEEVKPVKQNRWYNAGLLMVATSLLVSSIGMSYRFLPQMIQL